MASPSASQFATNFEKSWLKAVWMTPSDMAAPRCRLSRSSRSPRNSSAPAAIRDWAPASDRRSPSAGGPALMSSATMTEPMKPVAPVTKIRMMNLPLFQLRTFAAVRWGKYKRLYPYHQRDKVRIIGSIVRRSMDPLSDVLSLFKPRSYVAGGFEIPGETAIQWPEHPGIKCYAVVSGQCWLSVEGVPEAVLLP